MGSTRTVDTRASVAWLRRFARTTPGVLGTIAIAIAASCVIAGLVAGGQLNSRIAEHNSILEHSEPFAFAAQNLYAALSEADAAAATAFLSGGIQTPQMRTQYRQALADVASSLADATAGATDIETRGAVAEISAQLTTYTGLVESARANNLQGFPIGAAYLREASSLMQTKLLPEAERIYARNLAAVSGDQNAVGSTPLATLVLLTVVLVVIGVGSVISYGRTNRQFNVGLIAAAALVVVTMIWILGATRLAAGNIDDSQTHGTARFGELAKARILAQQGRTDETLELIARGDLAAGEKSFFGHIDNLATLVADGPQAATDGVMKWTESHRKQVAAYEGGDYPAAVVQAIGSDPATSAAQFAAVESSLRAEIEQTRSTLRDRVAAAGARLAWSPTGTLVLMTLAAAAAVVGLWPRLKEFL